MSDSQKHKPSRLDAPKVARRSFLSLAAFGSFIAAMATAVAGMLRLPKPAVLPGPASFSVRSWLLRAWRRFAGRMIRWSRAM